MIGAVTMFYSLLVVTLFVPVLGGLYVQTRPVREALAAIAAGVVTLFAVRAGAGGAPWLDPTLAGICAAATVFLGFTLARMAAGTSAGDCRRSTARTRQLEARQRSDEHVQDCGDRGRRHRQGSDSGRHRDRSKMAAQQGGFALDLTDMPWGCDYYLQTGRMLDAGRRRSAA